MLTVRNHVKVSACLILMLAAGTVVAQPLQPTEGKNLARGKACSFDPQPSYPDCTDKGDRFDLTDGLYNGCLWIEKGTVGLMPGYGWNVETMPIPLIDIDLGDAQPIGKVTLSSITGSGGVTFPLAVRVFVSTDAKHTTTCSVTYVPNRYRRTSLSTTALSPRISRDGVGMCVSRCFPAAP